MYDKKAVKYFEEGRVLERERKLSAAERAYNKAIKISPDFVEAHNNLGNVLLDRDRPKQAFNIFNKALKLRPGHPMLLTNLGNALQLQGEFEKAIGWFKKAITQDSSFAGAHNNIANAYRDLGRYQEAVAAYKQAIQTSPGIADTYYNLGSVLNELEEFDDAVSNFQKTIEIDPRHDKAYNGLGNAQAYSGKIDEAIASYRKAIEIDPRHKNAFKGLGNVLSDMGEIDQANASYRKAIELNPEPADIYRSLSTNKKFTDYDEDIHSMQSLYAKENLSDEQKMYLAFALGKAYEDLGEYEKSMNFIIEATRLKRTLFNYSIPDTADIFREIKETFSLEFYSDRKGMGIPDPTPIFILGMPRSGTSLVEQILASHPHVFGAGELTDLPILVRKSCATGSSWKFPERIVELDLAAMEDLGKEYVARIRLHSDDAEYITDKMPHNFIHIGLIKAILPNAKIIHCTRDPMDNCLSLFKNYFSSAHYYSYDLTELGQYYNLYLDLMQHWRENLSGFIYDQSYEALVADQESQIRQLLDYCHLPWDDACLEFHKTRRKVRTASNAQVRRPIYQDSVKLWKRYEKQLEPLRAVIYG